MQLEGRLALAAAGKPVDHAVGIAGDVLQGPAPGRRLIEPVNGHDREDLIDRPIVGQRLEDGKVAEVAVNQYRFDVAGDFRICRLVVGDGAGDRVEGAPVELLGVGLVPQ